jgi:hypothetical protein
MTDEPQPLDRDVLEMIQSALPATAVPDAARTRILSRVEASIALLPAGGTGHGPGPAASPRPSLGSPAAWIASHPWLAVSAAFALGGAAAAGVSASLREAAPRDRVVYVDRDVTPPSSPASVAPTPAPGSAVPESVPVEALPVASSLPPRGQPEDTHEGTGERLAAESAVLDVARSALAAGDGARALQAVDRHAAAFPRGLLTEEREALAIRALLGLERTSEARSRLSRFRTRYPDSLFLPAIESAMRNAPE